MPRASEPADAIERAGGIVREAEALLILAGAGMGVDSGLPDFRGPEGFWSAYPAYRHLGLSFVDLANPEWFARDPGLAWGFYGHRLNLYRGTDPHAGFGILKRWGEGKRFGSFVVTSNVDGHFQRAGFAPDRVLEVHGSVHHMQCLAECGAGIMEGDEVRVSVDERTFQAEEPYPSCPACGGLLRPNVLMFGDWGWDPGRTRRQEEAFGRWLERVSGGMVAVLEFGAGRAVPTIRHLAERVTGHLGVPLIRVNIREPEVPRERDISLASGALATLRELDQRIGFPGVA
jgi:NAD-dependent SIR2 family protein deacetylase